MNDEEPIKAFTTTDQYELRGLPITPAGIQKLIVELFRGQTVERHKIVTAVEIAHRERGGVAARAADFPRSVKKALFNLKEAGIADNPAHGFWRIIPNVDAEKAVVSTEMNSDPIPLAPRAEIILGDGDSAVYLYYFPAYRKAAEGEGKSAWPCKIGRSDRDPFNRIYAQASTALPEPPTIGLILNTSLSSQWEQVLHGILSLRGCIVDDAPGDEWFYTSPSDIIEIIHHVDPTIKNA